MITCHTCTAAWSNAIPFMAHGPVNQLPLTCQLFKKVSRNKHTSTIVGVAAKLSLPFQQPTFRNTTSVMEQHRLGKSHLSSYCLASMPLCSHVLFLLNNSAAACDLVYTCMACSMPDCAVLCSTVLY